MAERERKRREGGWKGIGERRNGRGYGMGRRGKGKEEGEGKEGLGLQRPHCVVHDTKPIFLHVYLFLQKTPAHTPNWPRRDVTICSAIEDNQHLLIQFWRQKTDLTTKIQKGDYISVYAVLTATYRSDKYVNSIDDTDIKVS